MTEVCALTLTTADAYLTTDAPISHLMGVPEPVTLSIFGAGLIGAAAMRRRKIEAA